MLLQLELWARHRTSLTSGSVRVWWLCGVLGLCRACETWAYHLTRGWSSLLLLLLLLMLLLRLLWLLWLLRPLLLVWPLLPRRLWRRGWGQGRLQLW